MSEAPDTTRSPATEPQPAAPRLTIGISRGALEANLRTLRAAANPAPLTSSPAALLAVIKANAYGHGAALCAPVLAMAGAEWLGVTDAAEGALVRDALIASNLPLQLQPQILVMCGLLPEDATLVRDHRLTPVVWRADHLDPLAAAHQPGTPPIPVHLEIDTGMARQGVAPGPALDHLLAHLRARPQLRLDGVFTHFASAEIAGSPLTAVQQTRFAKAVDQIVQLAAANIRPSWLHAGNSSTLDDGQHLPWLRTQAARLHARLLARAGLALFGHVLPLEASTGQLPVLHPHLQPVATWSARLLEIRELAPCDTLGYNATFTATTPMRVGLLSIGYADGLRRELSSTSATAGHPARPGGWASLHGHPAPILGRISMNLTTVDLTAVPNPRIGDPVTILGYGITAEQHAALAHTISYEILCAMRGHRALLP